jgi:endonuclease/exonuclease/phosphatase family metal-dependent hydrolase
MSAKRGGIGLALTATIFVTFVSASAGTLRVATYNLNADTPDFAAVDQNANLESVLEGIGKVHLNDDGVSHAQRLDVLAVQELQNGMGGPNAPTLASVVANLNAHYGAGAYAFDATPAPTTGPFIGNGPNGLVYNTATLQVVSATPIDGSGAPRTPMRYRMHPIGYDSTSDFYVIVSHMKAFSDQASANRRLFEALAIVNDVFSLPDQSHVILLGDLNITGGSDELTYGILVGTFDDVALPSQTWNVNTPADQQAIAKLLSDSATNVRFRDDMHLVTPSADPASGLATEGLQYLTGSSLVFGNGGATTIVGNAVTDAANNPGVFADLTAAERTALLNALTNATDHLPVVADYTIVAAPEPGGLLLFALPFIVFLHRRPPTFCCHSNIPSS